VSSLLLVRHAQASLFAENYDQLSALGREQASALGHHWRERDIPPDTPTRVLCGPARRHIDTLALARDAHGERAQARWPDSEIVPAFDEHDAFSLVAKTLPELMKADPQLAELARKSNERSDPRARSAAWQRVFEKVMAHWIAGEVKAEGVESWAEFSERVGDGLHALMAEGPGQNLILVTSVGPTAVILREAMGLAPSAAFRLAWRQRNCSRSQFLFREGELTLDAFNLVDHLPADMRTHR
jgi:broad specificity phosphatase PhoE